MVTKPAKETEFSKKKSLSEPKKDLAERLGDVLHKINRLTPGDTANGEAKVALRELSEVIRQALAERHDMISASDSWWVELAKRAMIAKVGMTGVAELLRGIMKDEKEMELQNFLREYFWIQ